jgi:hypothetical protein
MYGTNHRNGASSHFVGKHCFIYGVKWDPNNKCKLRNLIHSAKYTADINNEMFLSYRPIDSSVNKITYNAVLMAHESSILLHRNKNVLALWMDCDSNGESVVHLWLWWTTQNFHIIMKWKKNHFSQASSSAWQLSFLISCAIYWNW